MNKNTSDINPITRTILGYLGMVVVIAVAVAFLSSSANAGNAYGRDGKPAQAGNKVDHPGNAYGHAKNGGNPTPGANGNGVKGGNGVHANGKSKKGRLVASLGSLNAAHASINGLKHANPKSRVGMLATYMDALVSYEEKDPLYHQLVDQLIAIKDTITAVKGEINVVGSKIDAVESEIGAVEDKITDIDGGITDLANQIAALDPEAETYEADKAALGDQIATLEADKAALEGQVATLEADKGTLEANQDALVADQIALTEQETNVQGALDTVTAEINTALTLAADSLKQAANKDSLIDATVVNAVNTLLDGKSEGFTHSETIRETEEYVANIINAPE